MSVHPILDQIADLSRQEKLELAHHLWDELAADPGAHPLTDAQRRLLDQRLDDADDNPDDSMAWDEAKQRILSRLHGSS